MTNTQRARPEPVQLTAFSVLTLLMLKTAQASLLVVLNLERASFGIFEVRQFAIRVPAPCFASMLAGGPALQAPFFIQLQT